MTLTTTDLMEIFGKDPKDARFVSSADSAEFLGAGHLFCRPQCQGGSVTIWPNANFHDSGTGFSAPSTPSLPPPGTTALGARRRGRDKRETTFAAVFGRRPSLTCPEAGPSL